MTLPAPGAGRTAVVTGASSGIGAAIAIQLAAAGHHITLVARREDELRKLAGKIARSGGVATPLPTDLEDRRARAALPDRIAEDGRTVEILINNAGTSTTGPISKADPGAEMAMIEIDVVSVVDLCVRLLPGMVERGRGAILNVASTGAFQPLPGQAGYGASKAFVLSYTQSLSGEVRGTGVSVTVLCPGPVDTGFGERAGIAKEAAEAALPSAMWLDPDLVAKTAISGLSKGQLVVIPGLANRVLARFSQLVPNRLLIPMLARSHPSLRTVPR